MDHFLCKSINTVKLDDSEFSEIKRVINKNELILKDFVKAINEWEIPKIDKEQIYKIPKLNIFKTDYVIKTEKRDFQLSKPFEKITLLSAKTLNHHRSKKYKYIHIGLIQVGIKPLTREGLNTSILAVVRDARFLNFQDSLLGSIETLLSEGPISFEVYPDMTISLNDLNILESIVLEVKTHNCRMKQGPIPIALIYKIYYKAMNSAFGTKYKLRSKKGEIKFLQTDLTKTNTVIPKTIQWKDITLPEEWILEGVVPEQEKLKPNTNLSKIEQFEDGKVSLKFNRSVSSRYTESSSSVITEDIGRSSNLPSVIYATYKENESKPIIQTLVKPRFSTSDIPDRHLKMKGIDYSSSVPQAVYNLVENYLNQQAEITPLSPSSPSTSAITENINNINRELHVLSKENIEKKFLKEITKTKNLS
ncbi:uncharacterized protein LOC122723141 [Manihot esculenta]|uniref:uncharacterized protein LOC122723141 n=1 Tax=Manihot esculenta TaxID=3983 RepID=UPI001CC4D033|nr:uncharacterized protein LOC122723141 [Manihot esculenta]